MRNVGVFIYPNVELLDFCGPLEVFAKSRNIHDAEERLFNVYTVGENKDMIVTEAGVAVFPKFQLDDAPKPDILLIPGGIGRHDVVKNHAVMSWITSTAAEVELLLSVCSGSVILGVAGLLDGMQATTYDPLIEHFKKVAPKVEVRRGTRFVDNGRVITSAGITAGIDMALYVVERLFGEEQAKDSAGALEYVHYGRSKNKVAEITARSGAGVGGK